MKTLVNFRDAGGLTTKTGEKVVTGKIYRSGEIVALSAEDRQLFTDKFGIKTIYDFRSESEISERPDQTFPGVTYRNIDIMKGINGPGASLAGMESATAAADQHMKEIYREMVMSQSGQAGYREFLTDLNQTDDPFVFHCFAGKDRTGIGAALILEILGVPEKAIYQEYLLTNSLRQDANKIIIQDLIDRKASAEEIESVSVMMNVKKDYLDVAYAEMTTNFGSPLGYIKEALKFSPSDLATFRNKYLV